jgi:hypothetical protein
MLGGPDAYSRELASVAHMVRTHSGTRLVRLVEPGRQPRLRAARVGARRPDPAAAFQRFHDALAENFSPEEILEIVGVVVNMNVWTRIKLAEGAMPLPAD